jgi:type II secretory pathway pseudopilin PulG
MNRLIPASRAGRAWLRQSQLGMTLVEVVVALALAGLTVAGLVGGYFCSTVSAERSGLSLAANSRALERLEDTHGARWDTSSWPVVDELSQTNFPAKQVILDLSGEGPGTTYATNYTTISQISTSPQLRRIRVDCVWQFRNRQFSSLFTNTVETCRGPD